MPYERKATISTPPNNTILFKYMSLEKILNLLETKTLFFTKVSIFADPYEGKIPRKMLENKNQQEGYTHLNKYRNCMMCNCWHEGWRDTKPMWEEYTNKGYGIAIKTKISSLKKSLIDKHGVHIGSISYIDHENELFRGETRKDGWTYMTIHYHPYLHKGIEFKGESEVRAIINTIDPIYEKIKLENTGLKNYSTDLINKTLKELFPEMIQGGLSYSIDPSKLIERIIISPYYEKWQSETVKSTINKLYPDIKVVESHLKT